jgi:membrane fusion protein, multidrug efflux system
VRRDVQSVGSLFPYEEVTVSSEVEGRVEEVLVDVGDRVTAGQPLMRISPVELRISVEQQRATLEQARAQLGLAKVADDLKDVRDAAEVKKAAADLSDAEQKFLRAKDLFAQGLLPREGFDETESKHKGARAAYDVAIHSVENLQARLRLSRASLALAEKKLNDTEIRAPFAGQVKERTVTLGQYLKVQAPVVVILSVDSLRVRLKIPEKLASWIRIGQLATLSVEAYPGRTFSGKIWRINPAVDQQNRSLEVEALIENREGILKPGFFVKATIPTDRVETTLVVPPAALLYNYGVYKAFIVEGNRLAEREVKIGDRTGATIEVIEGLKQGERVALPVKGELRDGGVIQVVS